ncbi:histidine phosphatase family protein [Paracoccus sp. (in: a-proteobacteria)]|uniref:histidine phosphatase family protein n=1 Tax=Paracoccus sp. TaxID=267 RepID=UPI0026E0A2DD|nr:histidine phosphatase family protein [Paracoccus sp. (in: a-proteobacteria)]MDO5370179.1 histidine phosphatase family protein [Paracoccus sp. (in: a-proteobacteria)]
MPEAKGAEIILIRHASVAGGGRLAGRLDPPADLSDRTRIAAVAARLPRGARLTSSPARRCLMTAGALVPGLAPRLDERLWEQDFGDWEGLGHAELPDLGPLSPEALVDHRPPNGESFRALCARTLPALLDLAAHPGGQVVTAHAGTVRAALAHATGSVAGALSFQVAPLSLSRFHVGPQGQWSVAEVNWQP